MMADKLQDIVRFLFVQRPDKQREVLVKTDTAGKILEISGNKSRFSPLLNPEVPLPEVFPFLSAYFPVATPQTTDLPHIAWEHLFLHVRIFSNRDTGTWVLLSDVTEAVEEMQGPIQKNNDFVLKNTSRFTFENPFGNLHLFHVASFIKTKEGKFMPLGAAPGWVEKFFPQITGAEQGLDLIEIFPYLSVFLPEAQTFWDAREETLQGSDMWIETPVSGTELHFRAFATSQNDNHYLLIRLLDYDDIPVNQRTIQKAREHQLLYEKLQKAEKKLKQLLYYKDKFVSIVSHDLRSPMASVVSIAEMLLTDDELMASMSDFNREMLVSMKEELERLLEYNNRLYHWSNLELGNFKLDKEIISAEKLIHSALQTAKNKMEAKAIHYEAVVPEDFELEVDVSLFSQVLNNLLGNAVKFTPEGGTIKAGAKCENGVIRFFVSDTGVGMPEAMQKSVFAGVPNESTLGTSGEKGSGLGLDIVRKIVEAHGFAIAVESELGKGTTFIITAPKEKTQPGKSKQGS